MGDVVELPRTDEEMTLEFIEKYRSFLSLDPIEKPESLKEGLGNRVKLYRYKSPGRQFAITPDAKVKNALQYAGGGSCQAFRFSPEGEEHWDVNLPTYLWTYI